MALRFGATWELPAYLVLVSALLALSLIDLDTFLLPDKIVYPLTVALVVLFGLAAVLDDAGDGLRPGAARRARGVRVLPHGAPDRARVGWASAT